MLQPQIHLKKLWTFLAPKKFKLTKKEGNQVLQNDLFYIERSNGQKFKSPETFPKTLTRNINNHHQNTETAEEFH
jgi:hypothetical protein